MSTDKIDYHSLSDFELLILLRGSDHMAYKEIFNRYFGLLYIFIHKRLKEEDDAKDIVQELFAKIWLNRETLEITGSLSAYLYTVVRNNMLNLIGRRDIEKRYLNSLKDFIDQDTVMSDHLIREKQLTALIENEIDALPGKMREVFLLSRQANLTYIEISAQLDLNKQTVRSHIKHALKILRLHLGAFGLF